MKLVNIKWITSAIGIVLLIIIHSNCSTTNSSNSSDTNKSEKWMTGDIYQDDNGWIEARVGDLPLIISAPHGGNLKPDVIADRNCPNIVKVRDTNTLELALQIEQEFIERYEKQPYLVLNLLHRSKLDMNRNMEEATCGNKVSEAPWHKYHNYLETSIDKIIDEFGYAIIIDLHGHGHKKQRLELGYLIKKGDLKKAYYDKSYAEEISSRSSLRNLMVINADLNFHDLLFGENSFGSVMENGNVPAVPSLQDPYPLENDKFFNGGYNTRRYTLEYPKVFGLQIEANYKGLRESLEGRKKFSKAFLDAFDVLQKHIYSKQ